MPSTALQCPPPLRAGDRLDYAEFLRRWEAMPELKRAELLGGIVYMPSPISLDHGDIQGVLGSWLAFYSVRTPGCRVGIESTWIMGKGEVPQPDLSLRILPEHGGQSRKRGKYGLGAPELVVEVVRSSHDRDLRQKVQIYERAGVREYVSALVAEKRIIWRVFSSGKLRTLAASGGIFRSRFFPGLWLDAAAVWRCDTAALQAAVENGAAGAAHAEFVAKLKK